MENPTTKPKGALSAEARAKREVRVKIKLPGPLLPGNDVKFDRGHTQIK